MSLTIARGFGPAISRTFIYIVLVILLILCVVPIWLMLVNSTRSTTEIQNGLSLLPSKFFFDNWKILTDRGFDIATGFINSVVISGGATILGVYASAMTAYGLFLYRFKGSKFLFGLIVATLIVPPQLGIIGFYQYMTNIGLANTLWCLILPAIQAPTTVFFLRQYITGAVPKDLVDAARIDGAGEIGIFNRIVIPILSPGLATMAIFTFVGTWNNFITPFILLSKKELYTLPMLVQLLRTDIYRTEYGGIYLGIAISIIPILVFYAFMSRYIIAGVTLGGIKE